MQQEIKDWSKSHAELSEQIRSFEKSQTDLEVALTHKDDHINALTNCITLVNRLDCESEPVDQSKRGNESDKSANEAVGGKISFGEVRPPFCLPVFKFAGAPFRPAER